MDDLNVDADRLFSKQEYASRLARVRTRMLEHDLELLIVSDPCNIYYLTGYDGWSFYTPQVLIVSHDRDPLWVGRRMDEEGVRLLAWLDDASIVGYEDHLVQNASKHPFEIVADLIHGQFPAVDRVGIEKESYYLTAQAAEMLAGALKRQRLVDGSLLVNWVRFVKSPAEIELLKEAATLLDLSMDAAIDVADAGVRECDVAAAVYAANCRGTPAFGGVYTSSPAFICAGDRVSMPHLCWSDRRIAADSSMNLELMGNRRRYQVTMARTVHFGDVPAKLRNLEGIVVEGIERTLEAVRPGVTCEEIENVWRRHIARYGIAKETRCGYSLGIAYPPTGGEMTASIRPGDTTELEEGVAMHFLPAIWGREESLSISEPFVVTADGCECLSETPRRLFVKPPRPARRRLSVGDE